MSFWSQSVGSSLHQYSMMFICKLLSHLELNRLQSSVLALIRWDGDGSDANKDALRRLSTNQWWSSLWVYTECTHSSLLEMFCFNRPKIFSLMPHKTKTRILLHFWLEKISLNDLNYLIVNITADSFSFCWQIVSAVNLCVSFMFMSPSGTQFFWQETSSREPWATWWPLTEAFPWL